MSTKYKVKLAHVFDDGNKLEFEAHLEAASHDAAFETARAQFAAAVKALASDATIEIDKTKIESMCC